MKNIITILVGALAFLAISLAPASAQIIYNNLYAPTDGTASLNSEGPLANSFTITGLFQFTELSLLLDATDPQDGGFFEVSICDFVGGSCTPFAFIADLSLSTSPTVITFGPYAPHDFFVYSPYSLKIELTDVGSSSANWAYSSDISGTGTGDYWSDANGVSTNNSGHGPFQMLVAEVPEPSTWAMLLLGFAGLGFIGSRTSRRDVERAT